jgi:hypothetical protein
MSAAAEGNFYAKGARVANLKRARGREVTGSLYVWVEVVEVEGGMILLDLERDFCSTTVG